MIIAIFCFLVACAISLAAGLAAGIVLANQSWTEELARGRSMDSGWIKYRIDKFNKKSVVR